MYAETRWLDNLTLRLFALLFAMSVLALKQLRPAEKCETSSALT